MPLNDAVKQRMVRWAKVVALDEVDKFQKEREGTPQYGEFSGPDKRAIRQRIKKRISEDKKAKGRYGFIGITWILMVALGAVIQWAIMRWLDRIFPDR